MAEKAQIDPNIAFANLLAPPPRNGKPADLSGERIVNLQSRTGDSASGGQRGSLSSDGSADWSSAIELIREASEAIRISEDRAAELEDQLSQLTEDAAEQIRRLNSEISARDQRIAQGEERLRSAESRAEHAEAWLRKLYDAVHSSFALLRRQ